MGRTLKRVPLDFAWPVGIIWKGYLNPYAYHKCDACGGGGLNPAAKQLSDDWYDFGRTGREWCHAITQDEVDALVEKGRLHDLTRNGSHPTAQEVNRWSRSGLGHDAINQWICVEVRARRLGVHGTCPLCEGDGSLFCDEKFRVLYDEWERIEPPTGEGYQLWETTTEGSPKTPVFSTLDALCDYAAEHVTTFGGMTATADEWREMLDDGLVVARQGNAVFI